jgi:hypothetical protein
MAITRTVSKHKLKHLSAGKQVLFTVEMGGSLNVHSADAGLGATFTLEVPCKPPGEESSKAEGSALK